MMGYLRYESEALLLRSLLLCAAIISLNFLIGIFSPITDGLRDEIAFLDTLWRTVAGQRVGIDYHNPVGFGPYQLGALFWRWLGPHYYVLRLAITVFNLSIAACACVVCDRTLARRVDLTLLFLVTVAFELSAPAVYESTPTALSVAGFYDRQIVATLAVLFVQTFGGASRFSPRENAIEIALTALLLNALFLIKISGFVLGIVVVFAGCLLQDRIAQRIINMSAALIAVAAIIAIEFKLTGLAVIPVVHEYEVAAHARLGYSFDDVAKGILSWPLAISVGLLGLFALRQYEERSVNLRRTSVIIGSYIVCQFTLNMTNSWNAGIWLAPAAVICLVGCLDRNSATMQSGGAARWRRIVCSGRVEKAIPFLIVILVLIPQLLSSFVGIAIGCLVSLDVEEPVVVTAGKGISLRSLVFQHRSQAYELSLDDAVAAITSLKLDHEAIADLDFSNPFPVLFLAPPPRGIHVWWDWGNSLPRGARLDWQEVIGDACVVTVPTNPSTPVVTAQQLDIIRPELAVDFKMVYQDRLWKIYRRTQNCATGLELHS